MLALVAFFYNTFSLSVFVFYFTEDDSSFFKAYLQTLLSNFYFKHIKDLFTFYGNF